MPPNKVEGDSPATIFAALRRFRHAVWLDSALTHPVWGRWSLLSATPTLTAECSRTGEFRLFAGDDLIFAHSGDPFAALAALTTATLVPAPNAAANAVANSSVPTAFDAGPTGGWVGFLGYDLKNFLERLPAARPDDFGLPACWFGFYPAVWRYDHLAGVGEFVGEPKAASTREFVAAGDGLAAAVARAIPPAALDATAFAAELAARIASLPAHESAISTLGALPAFTEAEIVAASNVASRADYERAIARCVEYIFAGDIFQANISQRFTLPFAGDSADLYVALRAANPAPFAAFLDVGAGRAVLSSSPERFLKFVGDAVETRPIKGTRERRAGDEAGNARRRAELLASEKDRAELAMIVDLERNDLGRVCVPGSVRVAEDAVLETYATVFHLVSTVTGTLRPGVTAVDGVRAAFPGGSITGAPKIRAMEIIDELEPTARGVYTGSIGYFSHHGIADFNIAIRTMVAGNGRLGIQAGGGIVAESNPAAEYEETLAKARGMMNALRRRS